MVRAPFELSQVSVHVGTGQASGSRWYLCPIRYFRTKVFDGNRVSGFTTKLFFGPSIRDGQYIGQMIAYAGKETWRQV